MKEFNSLFPLLQYVRTWRLILSSLSLSLLHPGEIALLIAMISIICKFTSCGSVL